jgi:PKD repeat protein
MKTIKLYIVVCLTFILTQFDGFAQYNGGNSNGATANQLNTTSCSIPAHFYAYFGGNNDGSSVNELSTASCGTAAFQFAYMGGIADGAAIEELSTTACSIPPSFFAYMGGNNDGAGVETLEQSACAFPPQFYAYFGGQDDGFTMDKTAPICPTEPPVASFTASATEICVGQSVTFTDTSTNIPSAWTWTFEGGTPSTSTSQNPMVTYNTPGVYDVTLVAANYNGTNQVILTDHITVFANPTITSATGGSNCGPGTVTLSATASSGFLNWYDAPTGGNLLGTIATPGTYQQFFATTTTYYVSAAATILGHCESPRVPVTATITDVPTITSTTPATRCGSGSATISATASAGNVSWFDAPTGGTLISSGLSFSPNVTVTTTYYVETTLNGCASSRTPVVVTVNNVPTITSTTPASRCDAGIVTLQATASNGTLSWFNTPTGGTVLGTGTSFITPSISVSTNFYVESTDGTCTSIRTAVLATINVTPSITSTSPSQVCDSGTVTLGATANAGTLNWYNVATGGSVLGTGNSFTTPSITTTTTFYVEAVNGSCTSVRVPVLATVNATPSITSTTDLTVCGNVGGTLSATASAGTLYWYTLASGGSAFATGTSIPVSGGSFTYYVEAISNGCVSTRVPVVYTNNPIPTITSVTPAGRCDSGSVTLQATTDIGTVNWFDAPTGGNLVGTGTSFTTPVLNSTTTYYVESSSASCNTPTRTAVTATINEQPIITSITPASRCGDGSVTLQASASIGTIYWYNAPTGGTLVATGGTFATPVLGGTTTYYVEVVNGICTSARTAVVATVYAVSIITSTTPDSRCDVGVLTLQATSSNGVISWYDAPTGGNLLATGTSYTTPVITSTTTYYVETQNGDCVSSRTAVTASIVPISAPNGLANQSYCEGETVDLIAVTGSNIVWYDAATGGNIVPTGTAIVSGTTYYASQNVSGCESIDRLAVTMTLGGCLGIRDFETNVIQLYPNPVLDNLTISSTENMSSVEVVNMLGQVIFANKINEIETQIDMSRYATGTYIIRVMVDTKVEIFKVIKK